MEYDTREALCISLKTLFIQKLLFDTIKRAYSLKYNKTTVNLYIENPFPRHRIRL